MGLSAPGVGIHGTPDAASIGYSASHGCIRMQISGGGVAVRARRRRDARLHRPAVTARAPGSSARCSPSRSWRRSSGCSPGGYARGGRGGARRVERGERPAAPAFTLPRLDGDGELARVAARQAGDRSTSGPPGARRARTRRRCSSGLARAPRRGPRRRRHRLRQTSAPTRGASPSSYGMTYPLVHDRAGTLTRPLRAHGVPETFFVDRAGGSSAPVVGGSTRATSYAERFERLVRRRSRREAGRRRRAARSRARPGGRERGGARRRPTSRTRCSARPARRRSTSPTRPSPSA